MITHVTLAACTAPCAIYTVVWPAYERGVQPVAFIHANLRPLSLMASPQQQHAGPSGAAPTASPPADWWARSNTATQSDAEDSEAGSDMQDQAGPPDPLFDPAADDADEEWANKARDGRTTVRRCSTCTQVALTSADPTPTGAGCHPVLPRLLHHRVHRLPAARAVPQPVQGHVHCQHGPEARACRAQPCSSRPRPQEAAPPRNGPPAAGGSRSTSSRRSGRWGCGRVLRSVWHTGGRTGRG